ncbi:MAG: hypothetical protein ACRD3T_15415 [Terriglobia bacterium]
MKTDRKALLWGTIIAVGLVAAGMLQVFEFPSFRMPFTGRQAEMFLVSTLLIALLIASYRKLWKTPGFWALLLAFLGAHIAFYWLVVAKITEEIRGFRMDVLYGVITGIEVLVFALIVARLYHRGPDTSSFTGQKAR